MNYKTTDGLMRHLRNNGISIYGSKQKRQLMHIGYFHGYKGYRFFVTPKNKLPFNNFEEIYLTACYDSELKSLLYGKIMFIETAIKNIALECILLNAKSANIQDMYDKVIISYHNSPGSLALDEKKKFQQRKLNLQKTIQTSLSNAYKNNNRQITHFYNKKSDPGVPIWALFEILTMGDFGQLLSCLTVNVRNDISRKIGLNLSSDTNRQLVYEYIYILKDLRNAIAHNAVIFDTRFKKSSPSKAAKACLINEIGLPYVNFNTIGDYIILISYYLKILKVPKTEIKAFIRTFEKTVIAYKKSVNSSVTNKVIHPDLISRLTLLKTYI